MSGIFYDLEYINHISHLLNQFRQKDRAKYNFRCPFCGDSERSERKCRGYLMEGDKGLFYFCFNCDKSCSFSELIKHLDYSLYLRYQTGKFVKKQEKKKKSKPEKEINPDDFKLDLSEYYTEQGIDPSSVPETKRETPQEKIETRPVRQGVLRKKSPQKSSHHFRVLTSLSQTHPAVRYIAKRKIPKKFYEDIFYTEKMKILIGEQQYYSDPRVVFPCRRRNGEIFAYNGRTIQKDNKFRYNIAKADPDTPLLYGLHRLDLNRKIYVVEGPIDSLFLDNSLAICSAGLHHIGDVLKKHGIEQRDLDIVLVFDNEPRNYDIIQRMDKAIKHDYKVCIWPDEVKEKDINLMVLNNRDPKSIIDSNTYYSMYAKLQLANWSKSESSKDRWINMKKKQKNF